MGIADFLKDKVSGAPNWLTLPLLHMNRLGPMSFGPSMIRFKKSIPNIDPEEKLVDMVNYAIRHVPYYRDRYKGLSIRSVSEFENKIGFIDKEEVTKHASEFVSELACKIPHVVRSTAGTTGKPLHMLIPSDRYITEMAFVTGAWERAGWDYGIRASIRRKVLPQGKDFIVNPATREIIFDGYRTDESYLRKMRDVLKRNGVTTLYAYTSTAFQLLKQFKHYGIDVSFLKLALLTSEGVNDMQKRFIEDEMGLKISSFYGHTEKLIFIERVDSNTHAIEDAYGFTEIVGADGLLAKAGESGELVGTTFYNRVMPLIRYRTGDYATVTDRRIEIGNRSRRVVSSIEGRREKNLIYRHDGTTASATAFEIHDEHVMHVDGLQYVQHKPGYMVVNVIKGANFTDVDEAFMIQHYGHAMGGTEFVSLNYVDSLVSEPNGKTLTVINNCNFNRQSK